MRSCWMGLDACTSAGLPVSLPGNPQGGLLISGSLRRSPQWSCLSSLFPGQCIQAFKSEGASGWGVAPQTAGSITGNLEAGPTDARLHSALNLCCQVSSSVTIIISQGFPTASLSPGFLQAHLPRLLDTTLNLPLNRVQVRFPPHRTLGIYSLRNESGQLLSVPEYSVIVKMVPAQSITVWRQVCQKPQRASKILCIPAKKSPSSGAKHLLPEQNILHG